MVTGQTPDISGVETYSRGNTFSRSSTSVATHRRLHRCCRRGNGGVKSRREFRHHRTLDFFVAGRAGRCQEGVGCDVNLSCVVTVLMAQDRAWPSSETSRGGILSITCTLACCMQSTTGPGGIRCRSRLTRAFIAPRCDHPVSAAGPTEQHHGFIVRLDRARRCRPVLSQGVVGGAQNVVNAQTCVYAPASCG